MKVGFLFVRGHELMIVMVICCLGSEYNDKLEWIIDFSSFRSTYDVVYLIFDLFDLLLQSFILLFGLLVFLLELAAVHFASSAQHPLQIFYGIAWLFRLFVELHEDLGKLINSSSLLEILFELFLLGFDSSLL